MAPRHSFPQRHTSCCPHNIKANCYTTFVRPSLEYASSVWSPHTQKNIKKLDSVQRSARYVMNDFSSHSSVTAMMQHLEWQRLETRRQQAWLMMFYCIIHDLVDISANPYLTPAPLTTRGHQTRFFQPGAWVQCYKYSFFSATITAWNQQSVPLYLRASGTAWPLQLAVCAKSPPVLICF